MNVLIPITVSFTVGSVIGLLIAGLCAAARDGDYQDRIARTEREAEWLRARFRSKQREVNRLRIELAAEQSRGPCSQQAGCDCPTGDR